MYAHYNVRLFYKVRSCTAKYGDSQHTLIYNMRLFYNVRLCTAKYVDSQCKAIAIVV